MADDRVKKLEELIKRFLEESSLTNSNITSSGDYKKTIQSLQDEVEQKQREIDEAKKAGKELDSKEVEKYEKKLRELNDTYKEVNEDISKHKENLYKALGVDTTLFRKSAQFGRIGKEFTEVGNKMEIAGIKASSRYKKLGGNFTKLSGSISKVAGHVGIAITAVKLVDKAFGSLVSQLMKYKSMNVDAYLRSMNAETKLYTNSLNTAQSALKDYTEAASSSVSARIEGEKGIAKAQADTLLDQRKMRNSYWKWVPIWRHVLSAREKENELNINLLNQEIDMLHSRVQAWQGFAKDMHAAFTKFDIAQKAFMRTTGMPEEQMEAFRGSLSRVSKEIAGFGATQEELLKSRTAYITSTGRNRYWGEAESVRMMATGKVIGQDTMDSAATALEIFNKGVGDSADIMIELFKDANRMGLSGQKLTKNVVSNFKLAEKYNFKNGVDGFIKAAKWAESARLEMQSLASATERTQIGGLEGLLKQSAQLQVIGGRALMNSNPLRLAYNAFNDQEAYGKMLVDAFSDVGSFNRSTGEFKPKGVQNRIRAKAISDAFGLSTDEGLRLAATESKKNQIRESVSGRFSEDNIAEIANRAQWDRERQQFIVQMVDGSKKNVSDLALGDLNKIDTRSAEDISRNTMNATERTAALAEEINIKLAAMGGMKEFYRHQDELYKVTSKGYEMLSGKQIENYEALNEKARESLEKSFSDALNGSGKVTDILGRIEVYTSMLADPKKLAAWEEKNGKITNWKANTQPRDNNWETNIARSISNMAIMPSAVDLGQANDAMIYKDGKIVKLHNQDDVIAAKHDGAIHRAVQHLPIFGGGEIGASRFNPIENLVNQGGLLSGLFNSATGGLFKSDKNNISIAPIEININGKLDLTSGNQSVNIINMIQNNVELQKKLAEMVSHEIARTINGGRVAYDGGRHYK